jgi:hypothetical protein
MCGPTVKRLVLAGLPLGEAVGEVAGVSIEGACVELTATGLPVLATRSEVLAVLVVSALSSSREGLLKKRLWSVMVCVSRVKN